MVHYPGNVPDGERPADLIVSDLQCVIALLRTVLPDIDRTGMTSQQRDRLDQLQYLADHARAHAQEVERYVRDSLRQDRKP